MADSSRSDHEPFDLVVIGDVCPDLVLASPDLQVEFDQHETLVTSGEMTLGGSSAITACGAARLGLRTAFVGLVGEDAFGHWCREQLDSAGVDTSMLVMDSAVATGISVILQRSDDRATVTAPGSIAALAPHHIDLPRLSGATHLHVGSYFLQSSLRPHIAAIFRHLRATGTATSLDPNYDPADRWELDDVLDHCDVLFPNDAETLRFGGSTDLHTAATELAQRVGAVAVTLGTSGGLVASGTRIVSCPAPVLDGEFVDAIGAGDTFDAGFIAGLVRGWGMDQSLRLGLGAASLSVRGRGGTTRQGTLDEAMAAGGCDP